MQTVLLRSLARALAAGRSRRGLLGLIAAGGLNQLGPQAAEARKKRKHKKKHKQRNNTPCGTAGSAPVNDSCCAGLVLRDGLCQTCDDCGNVCDPATSILVNGVCQTCDVCASGCAFASVQAAIDAARAGATIALCPGTYRGNLAIKKDLRLVGTGDGTGANDTIIQGMGNASVVDIRATPVVLQQLHITGGLGPAPAIFNDNSKNVELIQCTVSGNVSSGSYGIAIQNYFGTLNLTDSVVSDNRNSGIGPGAILNYGTLNLTNSRISGNSTGGHGGGIFNTTNSTVTFNGASRVTGNTASNGGGIYNYGGNVLLAGSANVSDNTPNNCAGTTVLLCNA